MLTWLHLAHNRPVPLARLLEGRAFLTPVPGPRLYLRDLAEGRLERYALMVTRPDRTDDAGRLATVGTAHKRVPRARVSR